jgi:hypothetical protein
MTERTRQAGKREQSAVELAVASLDGNPNPMDVNMEGLDPDPTSLDLPEPRPHRGGPHAADVRSPKSKS